MKRALLIEWDRSTGKRAGGVNPRDPKLQCYGWQNTDVEPSIEIRLVEDDRDLSQYEGVKGVTILTGIEAINQAIDDNLGEQYRYSKTDSDIFIMSCNQKNVDWSLHKNKKLENTLKDLFDQDVAGIKKQKRFNKL